MALIIHNETTNNKNYAGQLIAGNGTYQIPSSELDSFRNSDKLISDLTLATPEASIEDTNTPGVNLTGTNAVNLLLGNIIKAEVDSSPPFAAKVLPNGKKLYSRVEGKSYSVNIGTNVLDFTIPYPEVKFNELEIIGSELGDKATLRIKDDDSGTYSTVPSYTLNTFGNNVNCTKDYYHRASNYDADLYYGMRIYIEFESQSAKTIYINYILHELKT